MYVSDPCSFDTTLARPVRCDTQERHSLWWAKAAGILLRDKLLPRLRRMGSLKTMSAVYSNRINTAQGLEDVHPSEACRVPVERKEQSWHVDRDSTSLSNAHKREPASQVFCHVTL